MKYVVVLVLSIAWISGCADDAPPGVSHACGAIDCPSDAICATGGPAPVCQCPDGFQGTPGSCQDANECALDTDTCDPDATCRNTVGAFTCACNDGYRGDGHACEDIDECAEGTATCDGWLACENAAGSFRCVCPEGSLDERCTRTTSFDVGGAHACIIRDGALRCWGDGLPDAEPVPRFLTAPAAAEPRWAQVTVGYGHACALDVLGVASCWGRNHYGQLGNGRAKYEPTDHPIEPVLGGHRWRSISAASYRTCAVGEDDGLWCWGLVAPSADTPPYTPTLQWSGTWARVNSGRTLGCAIQRDGSLWCWGAGFAGQPGDDPAEAARPKRVGLGTWRSVALGPTHACGLMDDGSLWCWGKNNDGQLGDGTTSTHYVPSRVGAATWIDVDAGAGFSCGVRADHTLWCWGSGPTRERSTTPVQVDDDEPNLAAPSSDWDAVRTGWSSACALRQDKSLWCWGSNDVGQLGIGHPDKLAPTRIGTDADWTEVTSGTSGTCAIRDGQIYCWGSDPIARTGSAVPALSDASRVWSHVRTTGFDACAVDGAGAAQCWGNSVGTVDDAPVGELAASTTHLCALGTDGRPRCGSGANLPTAAASLAWRSLSIGDLHGCGVRTDGTLWCWGQNGHGQLGDGTQTARTAMTPIAADQTWRSVSVLRDATCALRTDGAAYCWGRWPGAGGDMDLLAAARIDGDWESLVAGNHHACGLRAGGALACWGDNATGALGDGSRDPRLEARTVGGQWRSVAAGDGHTCAIRSDGSLWCWGANGGGQVGDGTAWSTVLVRATAAD